MVDTENNIQTRKEKVLFDLHLKYEKVSINFIGIFVRDWIFIGFGSFVMDLDV